MQAPLIALALWAQTETSTYAVEVRDARLAGPIDPHARRALTGREIVELGVTNLAEALERIPAAYVRTAGRGGAQVDVRGARKGAVLILLDGVPISDPFTGNFDVASIPATDITELRVSRAPASPVDGPGGHGGVVEILTRAASGKRRAWARMQVGTAPGARLAATAKGELADGWAARASASAALDARELAYGGRGRVLGQGARNLSGGSVVEWTGERLRASAELWAGDQAYFVPPSQTEGDELVRVDDELTWRGAARASYEDGPLALTLTGFAQRLTRDSTRYAGGDRARPAPSELEAARAGAFALASWARDALELRGSATFVFEDGRERLDGVAGAGGSLSVLEGGASARWRALDGVTLDGAVGATIPFLAGATPWPEARVALELSSEPATLALTFARKGRAPTLRERYQLDTGNPAIGPEQSWYGEAEGILRPLDFASLTGVAWVRDSEGLIKFPSGGSRLENTGRLLTAGAEAQLDLAFLERRLEAGVAYLFQLQDGESLLDFFPAHRAEAWIEARPLRRAGLWARAKYLGDRIDQQVSLGDALTFDAGAFARYDLARFVLRVENLFDTTVLTHVATPAFGRTLWLGVELEGGW